MQPIILLVSSLALAAAEPQRGIGKPEAIYVDASIRNYKKANDIRVEASCLKMSGSEIDKSELKSCMNYFKGKGNEQCGTDEPYKFCELKSTVVVASSRKAPGYASVSCKEVVSAMQWVYDRCGEYGGWSPAGKNDLVIHVFRGPLQFRVPESRQTFFAEMSHS